MALWDAGPRQFLSKVYRKNNNTAEHTPGPLKVTLDPYPKRWLIRKESGGWPIASLTFGEQEGMKYSEEYGGSSGLDTKEQEANAHLFAAAPALLEALMAHIRWEAEEPNTDNPTKEQAEKYVDMMAASVAAIAATKQ